MACVKCMHDTNLTRIHYEWVCCPISSKSTLEEEVLQRCMAVWCYHLLVPRVLFAHLCHSSSEVLLYKESCVSHLEKRGLMSFHTQESVGFRSIDQPSIDSGYTWRKDTCHENMRLNCRRERLDTEMSESHAKKREYTRQYTRETTQQRSIDKHRQIRERRTRQIHMRDKRFPETKFETRESSSASNSVLVSRRQHFVEIKTKRDTNLGDPVSLQRLSFHEDLQDLRDNDGLWERNGKTHLADKKGFRHNGKTSTNHSSFLFQALFLHF